MGHVLQPPSEQRQIPCECPLRLQIFPLSDSDASTAHAATLVWCTLLDSSSVHFMRDIIDLFYNQGVSPVKDWSDSMIMLSHFTTFFVTLISKTHIIIIILLYLTCFLVRHHARLGRWERQY